MPNYNHQHLRDHCKAQGYNYLAGYGLCAGVAQMAIQAFLAGGEEFLQFKKRLDLIATSTPLELSDRIRKAREAIAERSRRIRSEAKLAANEVVIVDLTEEEELLTETEAFFGGIELYQKSKQHRELFTRLISHQQVQDILPFMESTALLEQGGMRVVDSFPGIYSRVELQDYFNRLTQSFLHYHPRCDLAMGLGSMGHRISILFNSTENRWLVIDANNLPPKEVVNGAELASAVFVAFTQADEEKSAVPSIAFNTTVYATETSHLSVKKIMQELTHSTEYKRAHEITLSKVNERSGALNTSLANIAVRNGNHHVLKLIARAKPGALNESGYMGETPLHTAIDLNRPETVRRLLDEKASLEIKSGDGYTAFGVAVYLNNLEVMTVLLDE